MNFWLYVVVWYLKIRFVDIMLNIIWCLNFILNLYNRICWVEFKKIKELLKLLYFIFLLVNIGYIYIFKVFFCFGFNIFNLVVCVNDVFVCGRFFILRFYFCFKENGWNYNY